MRKLKIDVAPSTQGEGHGEGIDFEDKTYYYRNHQNVPRDKPAFLKWEGNWCGKVKGEVEYIIVAWDGSDFVLLEHAYETIKNRMDRFKWRTAAESIEIVRQEQEKRRKDLDAIVKCDCGHPIILIDNEQPRDKCFACFKKTKATAS